MKKLKNLVGLKFGRLTVVQHIGKNKYGNHEWLCQCDCGNNTVVVGSLLTHGNTKSCGCFAKEIHSLNGKKTKKYNTFNLSGEYGIGYTSKGKEFYFDLEDYKLIKDHYWHITSHKEYICSNIDSRHVYLHRFILNIQEPNIIVDHISHKTNDCRKINLRIVTDSQNQINRGLNSNNYSSCTGVGWNKQMKKWRSRITFNNKQIYLGTFDNFDDAVQARKQAEEQYFGTYSYDNSQQYAEQFQI